ncbi:hypothetical protein GLOIN_2v1778748 [Rhizophagus clarus]|uniref:Uncharacterized protein n=1 Tax=Rhizophagus clarus TaxID=94130 RepID=A0A8H3QQ51_9GLOM|nr:hypothetical protein GLOIN_2v1778748 [Rhizophagus clarus]
MSKSMDEDMTVMIEPQLNLNEKKTYFVDSEKVIPNFEQKYPNPISVFAFDNATSYVAYAPDALIAHHINPNPSDKKKFKDGFKSDGGIQ